jgi:hypothetical protein
MAKSFKDPGFAKEFKTLTGVDPSPITAQAIEAAIRNLPRDAETIALYKHLADPPTDAAALNRSNYFVRRFF